MQCFTYDSLNRLTKGTTSNDSAKGCNTQLGNGNYSEDYAYDSATGNLLSKTGIGTYAYSASHSHAVISTSANNWSFTYDSNGNMTQRNLNGTIYNYSYNAENKLTDVSGATTASFTYDGDGNRVKTVVGGTTTVFLGNYYEWTSSMVKKYYFAGTTRIAMRENSTLIFLTGDQLGSTSLVYKTDTGLVIKKLYKPWGETRYTSTTMPTKYQFTGQYREADMGGTDGVYYFVARWYDHYLNRWIQPDSIIPEASQGVQAWDRYAYTNNNPVRYNDPSGHCIDGLTTLVCLTGIAMAAGALIAGAISANNQYQETGQVDVGQVAEAALEGAVVGGGIVIGGATIGLGATIGASVMSGLLCRDGDCTNEAQTVIGATGDIGEQYLSQAGGQSQVSIQTSQGVRYIDQLVDGMAYESKVGYVTLTESVSLQVSKDAELLATDQVDAISWVFSPSPVTGQGGPSGPLYDLLIQNYISVYYVNP